MSIALVTIIFLGNFLSFSKFINYYYYYLGGGGFCLGFCFLGVLGVTFFLMAPSLHPLSVRDTPCPHYFALFILGGLSKHVKSVRPLANLVSHASQVVLSL
jgi:hypothetical protein